MFPKSSFVNTSLEVRPAVAHISSKGFLETFFKTKSARPTSLSRSSGHEYTSEFRCTLVIENENGTTMTTRQLALVSFFFFFFFLFYTNREKYDIPYTRKKSSNLPGQVFPLIFFLATFSYKKVLAEKFKTRSLLIDSNGWTPSWWCFKEL